MKHNNYVTLLCNSINFLKLTSTINADNSKLLVVLDTCHGGMCVGIIDRTMTLAVANILRMARLILVPAIVVLLNCRVVMTTASLKLGHT